MFVVAASAGGVDALCALLRALPADFPAPVIVLMHLLAKQPSLLREVLGRSSTLPVEWASPGARPEAGRVYVAPPAVHSVLGDGGELELDEGPPVHYVRPSADRLLASCASAYGPATVAVILTGSGVDGASGAEAVKAAGGTVIAQDEATSAHFGMPRAAIATGVVDTVLGLDAIAPELVRLTALELA
jgi:two-component system, chemotaxis family, protein-glutamate methylesterase/glutaminase